MGKSAAIKGLWEQQAELEVMKTPLGKGIKVVKTLIGTNSFYDVIEKTQAQRTAGHLLLKSPEKGIGHIIREGVPGKGGNLGQSSRSAAGQTHSISTVGIVNLLFPCLSIGYSIWWASQPELLNLNQIISEASICQDIAEGLKEIHMVRQVVVDQIESSYEDILSTQLKIAEDIKQKDMIEAAVN